MPPSNPAITYISLILLAIALLFTKSSSSEVSLSVTPRTIPRTGGAITIHWSGINQPSPLDFLGIYSPPDSPHDHYIGYVFLSTRPGWDSGSGNLTMPLVNLRSGYQFRIFHWSESEIDPQRTDYDHNPLPGTNHLLAESDQVGFESCRGPEQVHLALTGRVGEMRVMFVTGDGKESFVRYGLGKEERMMGRVVGTSVERYEKEDMCEAPANDSIGWRDPGFIHDGVMVSLEDGKRYYYQVGSDAGCWSPVYSFVSPIRNANETLAFLFGDMGTSTPYSTFYRVQDESVSTIKWISRDIKALGEKPFMISHIGDISYARGYSWIWDNFFNQIEPIASASPYMVCIGNHEYDWPLQPWKPDWSYSVYHSDGGGECGVPYSLRFHMPGDSTEPTNTRAPHTRNLYYSFDLGTVHFVYFSTETNFLPGSKQFEFLKNDLESINRTETPFVVVQGHRPMYTTSYETRDAPLRKRLLEHIEPLLVKNNVTVVLWGHVHRYERFCPLSNFSCGEGYPVHVVIGMAGQDWQPTWQPRIDHLTDPVFPQPAISLYRGGEFGYVRLEADRERLRLSYVGNHDGEVHDVVEITALGRVFNGPAVSHGGVDVVVEVNVGGFDGGSRLSWCVKVASLLVLGAFVGYVVGFVSRSRSDRAKWAPVKSDDS